MAKVFLKINLFYTLINVTIKEPKTFRILSYISIFMSFVDNILHFLVTHSHLIVPVSIYYVGICCHISSQQLSLVYFLLVLRKRIFIYMQL